MMQSSYLGEPYVPSEDPCPICHGELSKPPEGSFNNVVVKTACLPQPHRFHFECANTWYNHQKNDPERMPGDKPINRRECAICRQDALPLERVDGTINIDEDNKFFESLPVKACRTGNLRDLSKVLSARPSISKKRHYDVYTQEYSTLENIAIKNKQHQVIQKLCDHEKGLSSYFGLSALAQKEYNNKLISIISREVRNRNNDLWSHPAVSFAAYAAYEANAGLLCAMSIGGAVLILAKKLYPDYDEKNEAPPLPLSEIKGLIKDV